MNLGIANRIAVFDSRPTMPAAEFPEDNESSAKWVAPEPSTPYTDAVLLIQAAKNRDEDVKEYLDKLAEDVPSGERYRSYPEDAPTLPSLPAEEVSGWELSQHEASDWAAAVD
jgi:hypothetical protein